MKDLTENVVSSVAELRECCAHLADCPTFGFDTEFIGEEYYQPQLCLVQVATPTQLYLIDPLEIGDISPFWELVADDTRVTVVHAGREEIRMCAHHLGRPPQNVFDLQVAAGLLGAGFPVGHAALVQQFLRVRINKGETLTDWSRRPLTKHQIRYAYDDVRYLLPLYERLHRRLADMDRLHWAAEEFETLQRRSLDDDPEREPWRKLRALGSLDRTQLAVVREVYAWRDERAAKINRPARYILRDDLVVEIGKRMPTGERELTVMRGVTRHDLVGLLAAVERGRNIPEPERPDLTERDNDPPQVATVASFLLAALGSYCARLRLTPSVAATSQDVKKLIKARLAGRDVPDDSALATGWRANVVLPVLRDLLEGRRSVHVGPLDSASPLQLTEPDATP